jgi:ABC transport system ATP-binding/permease protein
VLAAREVRRFIPSPSAGHGRRGRKLIKPVLHLLIAPALVALLAWLADSHGMATTAPNGQLTTVLSVLSITAAFFAAALTSGSIVSDYDMLKREARWGIGAGSVVFSRFLVFGTAAIFQGALASAIFLAVSQGPTDDHIVPGWILVVVSLCLLCLASSAAGLFVSSLARTLRGSVFALMMLSVAQVVLCGLIIPLGSPKNAGDWALAGLSLLMPTRWAVAALGSGINLNAFSGIARDTLWSYGLLHVAEAWAALIVLTAVFIVAAVYALSARLHRRL